MGKRKELFTLLGVAAAVAVVSTGLFYGLVINRLGENANNAKAPASVLADGDTLGIPAGMRAVSVNAIASSGIVKLLKAGHRVDVQMVYPIGSKPGATGLRTVVQNLEVYRVEEGQGGREQSAAVVTLLARPDEADVLGLADAAARVRLLLRHPEDSEVTVRKSVELNALTVGP
jgi:Flp pilus assembly protein CpaB